MIRDYANETVLIIVLGAFIILVSAVELIGLYIRKSAAGPLPRYLAVPVILGGGILHGLFATGGPVIVYYAGREIREPQAFLGTLAVLWLILNVVLYATMWISGKCRSAIAATGGRGAARLHRRCGYRQLDQG